MRYFPCLSLVPSISLTDAGFVSGRGFVVIGQRGIYGAGCVGVWLAEVCVKVEQGCGGVCRNEVRDCSGVNVAKTWLAGVRY